MFLPCKPSSTKIEDLKVITQFSSRAACVASSLPPLNHVPSAIKMRLHVVFIRICDKLHPTCPCKSATPFKPPNVVIHRQFGPTRPLTASSSVSSRTACASELGKCYTSHSMLELGDKLLCLHPAIRYEPISST
jgi:hypothetical protein